MICVLLVDDHPALRAGLSSLLRAEPGFTPAAAAGSAREGLLELGRWDIDVAIVDYHLPDEDGLSLCCRIKAADDPPGVLVYSASADADLALPAIAAGADGLASKAAPAGDLFDVIRLVARGDRVMPSISPELLADRTDALDHVERRTLERLVDGADRASIAAELGAGDADVLALRRSILEKLRVDVRAAS